MHHAAEAYDVGIYFEANGHGTVLFKDAFLDRVRAAKAQEGATVRASEGVGVVKGRSMTLSSCAL